MSALLRETAKRIKEMALSGTLVEKLSTQMLFQLGKGPAEAEQRSWKNSLIEIAEIFCQCGLEDVNFLVEYQLPYSSKRIDLLVIGSDPNSGKPSLMAIELKQWTDASLYENALDSVKIAAYGPNPILHPVKQVSQYCEYLSDFNHFLVVGESKLYGLAYLHNWLTPNNPALDLVPPSDFGILFTGCQKICSRTI